MEKHKRSYACEAKNCAMCTRCAKWVGNMPIGTYQSCDLSTMGGGQTNSLLCNYHYYCGDNSKGYPMFEDIKKEEKTTVTFYKSIWENRLNVNEFDETTVYVKGQIILCVDNKDRVIGVKLGDGEHTFTKLPWVEMDSKFIDCILSLNCLGG
jgi:hypothetical protein